MPKLKVEKDVPMEDLARVAEEAVHKDFFKEGPLAQKVASGLKSWARTAECKALLKSIYQHGTGQAEELAKAIATASRAFKSTGLPGAALAPIGGGYASQGQKNNLAIDLACSETGAAEALQEVRKAGIDPWIIIERERAEPAKRSGADYEDYLTYSYAVAPGAELGRLAMGVPVEHYGRHSTGWDIKTRAACSLFMAMVLEHAPKRAPAACDSFCAAVVKEFTKAHDEALQGAAGVMGAKDKRARLCAELLLGAEGGLLAVAGKSRLVVEAALEKARLFKIAKKTKADFDPAKYKKALAPEKRERLLTLTNLLDRTRADPGCAVIIARSTSWLAAEPHSLCLPFRNTCSVLDMALERGDAEVVKFAEEVGANIWIAAAQAEESNACQWACQLISQSPAGGAQGDMLKTVARMLAWGAHLDGAADPVDYALKKLDVAKLDTRYGASPSVGKQVVSGMRAQIEAIVFEKMLKEHAEANAAAGAAAGIEPEPALIRRRNAL
jgi:hypothetical protein